MADKVIDISTWRAKFPAMDSAIKFTPAEEALHKDHRAGELIEASRRRAWRALVSQFSAFSQPAGIVAASVVDVRHDQFEKRAYASGRDYTNIRLLGHEITDLDPTLGRDPGAIVVYMAQLAREWNVVSAQNDFKDFISTTAAMDDTEITRREKRIYDQIEQGGAEILKRLPRLYARITLQGSKERSLLAPAGTRYNSLVHVDEIIEENRNRLRVLYARSLFDVLQDTSTPRHREEIAYFNRTIPELLKRAGAGLNALDPTGIASEEYMRTKLRHVTIAAETNALSGGASWPRGHYPLPSGTYDKRWAEIVDAFRAFEKPQGFVDELAIDLRRRKIIERVQNMGKQLSDLDPLSRRSNEQTGEYLDALAKQWNVVSAQNSFAEFMAWPEAMDETMAMRRVGLILRQIKAGGQPPSALDPTGNSSDSDIHEAFRLNFIRMCIMDARDHFNILKDGTQLPQKTVTYLGKLVRQQLERAGAGFAALDPTGKASERSMQSSFTKVTKAALAASDKTVFATPPENKRYGYYSYEIPKAAPRAETGLVRVGQLIYTA